MEDFIIKHSPEYIFFLQHPEKQDHYLIIQDTQTGFDDTYTQFNRSGIYENGPVTMPYNKVKLVEKIRTPDRQLFGLLYYICNETNDIVYKEDERIPYGEWGWYIIKGDLQINKWLKSYSESQEVKQKNKAHKNPKPEQIRLF